MKIQFDASEYTLLESEADLLTHYSAPVEGIYRPQPYMTPDKYPCMFKEICILDNPRGADKVILSFIYDFEKEYEHHIQD